LRILVPIDGSEESNRAADYAIALAKKEENVQLIALHHVFSRQEYSFEFFGELAGGHASIQVPEKIKVEVDQWFNRIREKIDQNKILLSTDTIVSSKHTVPLIVDYAEENKVDLIVVGSRGRSGFAKLLLGSVAIGIVSNAKCTVTVVK
jgi:nucleotide-binding universal stress UspA family protein